MTLGITTLSKSVNLCHCVISWTCGMLCRDAEYRNDECRYTESRGTHHRQGVKLDYACSSLAASPPPIGSNKT